MKPFEPRFASVFQTTVSWFLAGFQLFRAAPEEFGNSAPKNQAFLLHRFWKSWSLAILFSFLIYMHFFGYFLSQENLYNLGYIKWRSYNKTRKTSSRSVFSHSAPTERKVSRPANVLVFEDSANGVLAAVAASVQVVMVPYPTNMELSMQWGIKSHLFKKVWKN